MFQHVFWFFGHPEVYILILPAFGIISQIIPTFCRKPLFGYESMVYATASIAFISFIVWAHHMFTVGMPLSGELFFMYTTMLIAVPTGVKVFNWIATMWRGAMSFETPMLWAIAFVVLFTIGGFSGLMLAITPVDFQYHDTYFVVAHFHYVLVTGAIFAIIAGAYYWLPKWTGHMYDEAARKVALLAVDDLRQRAVLPPALPGPGGNAATDPRLRRPVHRLEHGLEHRRIRIRALAAPVPLHRGPDHSRRRESDGSGVGGRARPSSGRWRRRLRTTRSRSRLMSPRRKPTAEVMHEPMAVTVEGGRRRANVRLAIVLAVVAVTFYIGIFVLQHS